MGAMATVTAMDTRPAMTRQEVARAFNVSTKTIQRWEKIGLLESVRIGRSVRYRPEDIAALLGRKAS